MVIRFSSWAQCAAAMLALLLMLPAPVRAEVSASVDRNRVAMSETLELRIRVDTTLAAPEPELGVLSRDFELLGTSRNTRISLVNGQGEAYTEWIVSLAPKREGPLEIPAIPVGAEKTEPIRISVARDASPDASPNQDVMLEVAFDQSAVHVQSQLLLTVRVLHAVNLSRGASLSEPDIANAVVRQLGEDSYARTIGGRRYGVFERRYAVFPQASGELVLPPLSFQATLGANSGNWFNQFGSRGNTIRLRSPERRVTVAPPESGGGPWLPARMLTLVETWDKSPQRLRVGESATRTLTITAEGLTGAQLPPLTQPEVRGLRFYPDQPRISDEESSEGITGTRVESAAVIPSEPGELEFPEVRVRWWDTVNQRFEEAVVPRKTIRVLPAAGSAASGPSSQTATPAPARASATEPPDTATAPAPPAAPSAPPAPPWPWVVATVLLATAALFSSLQWWRLARGRTTQNRPGSAAPSARERELYLSLRSACRRSEAAEVERLLPAWAQAAFPAAQPRSLADVARLGTGTQLADELKGMMASRYAGTRRSWDGAALLAQIEALRSRARAAPASAARGLPPLYAQTGS